MNYTTKKATMADLDVLCEIEKSAMGNLLYMYDNRNFYFGPKNRGEMILVSNESGLAVGIGQYSVLPDGAGWLEILRVRKENWRQGAGRAIYKRYMEIADETKANQVAMYTGATNVPSRGLAEVYGFHLTGEVREESISLTDLSLPSPSSAFRLIKDKGEAVKLLTRYGSNWGPFVGMNRTFFHPGPALYGYMVDEEMVYSDGTNVVVLGCRMLRERGLYVALYGGDAGLCLDFAKARAKELGAVKLFITMSRYREDVLQAAEKAGFANPTDLIVMEWTRPRS